MRHDLRPDAGAGAFTFGAIGIDMRQTGIELRLALVVGGGHQHVAGAGRTSLAVVAIEQSRTAPALQGGGQFPAQIDRIGQAGVHAQRASG